MPLRNAFVTVLMALVLAAPAGAAAKNIFDDDWEPPKPAARPPTAPVADPAVRPPSPNTPVAADVAPAKRLPIPDRAAQIAVRKVMREVFAEQLADPSPAARR